jgi:hypothetical protein
MHNEVSAWSCVVIAMAVIAALARMFQSFVENKYLFYAVSIVCSS